MYRLVAFLLILLILLNVGGFYALFWGLEYKIARGFTEKIDSEVLPNAETILLKVPLKLPYASNLENYKRVDGVFEHEGQVYRLIKQKFHKDTLHFIVYNDKISSHLNKVKLDFAKTISDNPVESKSGSGVDIFKSLIKDYINHPFHFQVSNSGSLLKASDFPIITFFSLRYLNLPHIPPEIA